MARSEQTFPLKAFTAIIFSVEVNRVIMTFAPWSCKKKYMRITNLLYEKPMLIKRPLVCLLSIVSRPGLYKMLVVW